MANIPFNFLKKTSPYSDKPSQMTSVSVWEINVCPLVFNSFLSYEKL